MGQSNSTRANVKRLILKNYPPQLNRIMCLRLKILSVNKSPAMLQFNLKLAKSHQRNRTIIGNS